MPWHASEAVGDNDSVHLTRPESLAALVFAVIVTTLETRRANARKPAAIVARLTPEQACDAALERLGHKDPFFNSAWAHPQTVEGRVVWSVSSNTVGSGWHAVVDDETGVCTEVTHWGLR